MANLTITIDDDLLRRARIRAAELGTSVNAVLREYVEAWVGVQARRRSAIDRFVDGSKRSRASSGGRKWSREDVHDRR